MFGRGFDATTIRTSLLGTDSGGVVVLKWSSRAVRTHWRSECREQPLSTSSLSADTNLGGLLQKTATSNVSVANGDLATPAEWVTRTTERLAISDKQEAIVIAALPDSSQMLPAGSPSVQAKASTPDLALVEYTGAVVESSRSPTPNADMVLGARRMQRQ